MTANADYSRCALYNLLRTIQSPAFIALYVPGHGIAYCRSSMASLEKSEYYSEQNLWPNNTRVMS